MPEYLTYARALELLREVIAEFGSDHVYAQQEDAAGCLYVHDDGPGCIVGHVLHRAGVSLDDLRLVELSTPADDTERVEDLFGQWASPSARVLLAAVQREQDGGREWGEALSIGVELAGDPDE